MSDIFVDGQDGSCVGLDVIFGLGEMKLEESDCKKNSSLNSEPQLLHSNEKNWKVIFFYVESDRILQSEQTVKSEIDQSLMVG